MIEQILNRIFFNQWSVLIIVSALLLLLAEIGYRFGRVSRRRNPEVAEGHGGAIQGAVLGLLGLLLGFTFAMAVGRYDARRTLVTEEANSIGTTWLRADFLPPAQGTEVRKLLLRYTELRLEGYKYALGSPEMAVVRSEIAGILQSLWSLGHSGATAQPSPLTAGFITSLNETIDLDATRLAATRNHVPGAVWLLLLVVAGCGAWASGFVSGSGGLRSVFSQWIFPLLIGVVVTLISDIDRPRMGMIGISQEPMIELLESLKSEAP
jgi:hypothetical protein